MNVVWNPPGIVAFVASRCDERPDYGNCQTAGVFHKGALVAGVIFHNWSPKYGVIEVSAASDDPRWATRGVLNELFGYVFSVAQMCVARTDEDNLRTRRLWKAFGATEYIIPRLRGREASEAVETLTDDAWEQSKFMRLDNVQRETSRAA